MMARKMPRPELLRLGVGRRVRVRGDGGAQDGKVVVIAEELCEPVGLVDDRAELDRCDRPQDPRRVPEILDALAPLVPRLRVVGRERHRLVDGHVVRPFRDQRRPRGGADGPGRETPTGRLRAGLARAPAVVLHRRPMLHGSGWPVVDLTLGGRLERGDRPWRCRRPKELAHDAADLLLLVVPHDLKTARRPRRPGVPIVRAR